MGKPVDEFTVPTMDHPDHERADAQIRPLALFLAGLVISLVFVGLVVWLLFDIFLATINASTADSRPAAVPRGDAGHPVLQVVPSRDMNVFRAREDRALNSAAWVDREKGIARIPIAAAMEQVATQGLPKWPAVVEQPTDGAATPPEAQPPAVENPTPQNETKRGPQ